MLIVLYTRKRHGRHERLDNGSRISTSAENDFKPRHERKTAVKTALNLMFFLIVTCDTSWSWWPKKSNYVRKARAWQQICNTHLRQFTRSGHILFGKLQNLNSQEMQVAPLALQMLVARFPSFWLEGCLRTIMTVHIAAISYGA